MGDSRLYFRHSGRVRPANFLLAAATIASSSAVAGIVYAFIEHSIPLIYVRCVLPLGPGLALAFLARHVLIKQHVRGTLIAVLLAIAGGIIAEYAAFTTWILILTHYRVLILDPTS